MLCTGSRTHEGVDLTFGNKALSERRNCDRDVDDNCCPTIPELIIAGVRLNNHLHKLWQTMTIVEGDRQLEEVVLRVISEYSIDGVTQGLELNWLHSGPLEHIQQAFMGL